MPPRHTAAVTVVFLWWSSLLVDIRPVSARLAIETTGNSGDRYKTIAEYDAKFALTCDTDAALQDAGDPSYAWRWYRGDNRSTDRITEDFDDVRRVRVTGNTLTFDRFVDSDAGLYTCKLVDHADAFVDAKVTYVAVKPYVKLPKTATFNEGERMELKCTVHGVPTPEISWRFENTALTPSSRVSFAPDGVTNASNTVLVMDPVAAENSGRYYCAGKSAVVAEPVISDPSDVHVNPETTPTTTPDPVDLAEQRAIASEQRAAAAEQRATAAERRAAMVEQRAAMVEQRATMAEQRATVAEQRATVAEQRAVAAEKRQKCGPPPSADGLTPTKIERPDRRV